MASEIPKRILIVEDDEGISHLESSRLERCGHQVTTARTTTEALRVVEKNRDIDLFILDYSLNEDINGLALFLILKERGFNVPAILVTGFEDPKIIMQAMRSGVRDFVPKTPEFLDDLPITVERVLRQVTLERQAAETAAIREKQELLEAAFDAGRLASFTWAPKSNELRITGHMEDIIGETRVPQIKHLDDFLALVHPADQAAVRQSIAGADETKAQFEQQFRIYRDDGSLRWVFGRGRSQFDEEKQTARFICVLNDITHRKKSELELLQSNQKIKALNDRLQMGMVETNHRVKNHLQKIISLLNYQIRNKKGTLCEEDVRGIVSHIHGLATLHDVLSDEVRSDGDGMTVDASDVLGRVIDVLGSALDGRIVRTELESCRVTPRQASSLSVILNELISNALKHGAGAIEVGLQCKDGKALLTVHNQGSLFPEQAELDKSDRTGLVLVKMLCQSDLGTEPQFINTEDKRALASINFLIGQLRE